MTANNLKGTGDSPNGDSKENLTSAKQVQQDPSIHINGTPVAKTGGQVIGGVIANSGDRIQAENQNGPESI